MKKTFLYTYLLIAGFLLAGCSQDDTESTPADGMAQVRLRLSVAGSGQTRAWTDDNATDAEMMNIWVVVITNSSSNAVEKVIACKPTGDSREIDPITELPLGTHNFYSFANMSVAKVATTLGITVNMPTMSSNDVAYESTEASGTVDADKAVTINGNGFAALTSSDNNGFDSYGIPMSNVQTATIHNNTTMDLIVVRMMAKMTISVTNKTGANQYIKYATISNITDNVTNNLKLLPNYTDASSANTMEAVHGDIQPNLNGTPATTELPIPGMATATELAKEATREVTFYINECKKPTNFELTIGLGDDSSTQEYRYALIDNKGATTDDDNKWDYIARNDYRIIPIILDNYKLELVPYDFPPIGVYPVSVSEIDNVNHVYEFTFHDYGHFHLVPKVTNTSDNSSVAYSATTPSASTTAWTLNTDWAGTLKTAAAYGGTWLSSEQVVANGFYRNQTAIVDGDEAGGVPVFYANTSSPQWDPAGGTSYRPFIFGYIAEPPAEWWVASPRTDRQIYHEFRVKLYVNGSYRRDLTYRYYMTLDAEQMLGSRRMERNHIMRYSYDE